MKQTYIDTLHCPYTGSAFRTSSVMGEDGGDITYGVVASDAGEFPIIDGILRLHVDEYQVPLVTLLKQGELQTALSVALDVPSHSRSAMLMDFASRIAYRGGVERVARYMALTKQKMHGLGQAQMGSFSQAVKAISSGAWGEWQLYRFSMPTFLPVFPLLHALPERGPILDFGSGVGHAAFLLSRAGDAGRVTCTDYSFCTLHLARRYLVPDATFLCLDGDYLLPFASGYFAGILSSDTLHCVDSKLSLSQEFKRILAADGTIILPHLHNGLSPVRFRKAMRPVAYGNLFNGWPKRVIPEEALVKEYIDTDTVDLQREWPAAELDGAQAGVSVVTSPDPQRFRVYRGVWDRHITRMRRPAINPVYRQSQVTPGIWRLERRPGDLYTQPLLRSDTPMLPEHVRLEVTSDEPELRVTDLLRLRQDRPAVFGALAKQFVVIDLPERYM